MGLLDGVLGNALGGLLGGQQGSAAQSPLMAMVLQLIQQSGGLPAILDKFRQAGLGAHADSWVSTGQNMPISPEQVSQVLGQDTLAKLGAQVGLDPATVGSHLSQLLPSIIDKATPDGQVPANHHDLLSQGLSALLGGR